MKKLLIIEDDPYVQRVYQRLFAHEDYDFELANDGEEGLKKAKKLKPALILLDIMMPKMNGIEVLAKLKKDPVLKEIPVVILTNYGEEEYIREAASMGADSFMIKSDFEPEEIKRKVESFLEQ